MTENGNGYRPWRIASAMVVLLVVVAQSVGAIVVPGYKGPADTTLFIEFTALISLIAAETLDIWRRR
jgi:hypothetical protein